MRIANVKRIRDMLEQYKRKTYQLDSVTNDYKKNADGSLVVVEESPALWIRLDNEHILEPIHNPIWDDEHELLMWCESPTRGNTFSVPTGSAGSRVLNPMKFCFADYDQIQEMAFFPYLDQAIAHFRNLVSQGLMTDEEADNELQRFFNTTNQQYVIDRRKQNADDPYGKINKPYEWPAGNPEDHDAAMKREDRAGDPYKNL